MQRSLSFLFCGLALVGLMNCQKEKIQPNSNPPTNTTPITGSLQNLTGKVSLGGNAFVTNASNGGAIMDNSNYGLHNWTDTSTVTSTYFKVTNPGILYLGVNGYSADGTSTISLKVNDSTFKILLNSANPKDYYAGGINITTPGYIKVDIKGVSKSGTYIGDISSLLVGGPAAQNLVYANDSTNFYWSRRGTSVHLSYSLPKDSTFEWMYNEITVPTGGDNIGSYYQSNGFNEGYFGIQVKSETTRWVIFSVWDPSTGHTTLVDKGADVVDANFGGEGTGGQSYLVYNWLTGNTYKFLTRIRPDNQGNTLYSSWFFAPELNKWLYMATFKRPQTNTYAKGPYSFLENFMNTNGYQTKKAYYSNHWERTVKGAWLESTTATYTCDATGTNKQRLDFKGGVENGKFFLQTNGFFNDNVAPNQNFTRPATNVAPQIDLNALPTT